MDPVSVITAAPFYLITHTTIDWTDEQPPACGLYYLRVRQRDLVHGRLAMAWSSPVWVERA